MCDNCSNMPSFFRDNVPTFRALDRQIDFVADEKACGEFWEKNNIFDKQVEQGKLRAEKEHSAPFVFYEGPPTANGTPHPGHVLTRAVKDIFLRFAVARGHDVPRKAGWDTHGLPVEIEVEKRLGFAGKEAIEKYGVENFIKECRNSVFKYSDIWSEMTKRIAFWVDLEHPYVTYHQSYIESVWWSLKTFFDEGLLYNGHKIVPWCPRCGTALSSHEVGQGYKEVEDPTAYVGFKSTADPNVMFVAWTTTPWTLLSNVALAVGVDFDYDYAKVGDETLVLASSLRQKVLDKIPHEVVKTVKGRDLLGQTYQPLYQFAEVDQPAWRIIAGDFVGLDTGSGIVHIAPAFGEDDFRVGKANDLPMINLVNPDGTFVNAVDNWSGMFVKDADPLIIKELKARKLLVKSERYKHDYPFCWRCPSPLLYYPRPAWYIRTSDFKDEMLKNNAAIDWHPAHVQGGRFGKFLESNIDWALSRERYWGTPLPLWICENADCKHITAIGSEKELHEKALNPDNLPDIIELHKPYVDEVAIKCEKCNKAMKRVPEVIDCWYDSGAMPFAQWGYPYQSDSVEKFTNTFPADFISEAVDQTRGWFYSLLAISTLLKVSAQKRQERGAALGALEPFLREYPQPFKQCLVMWHVCDEKGFKMSKSKGNYLDPFEIINGEGSDAMRWYFYSSNNPWTNIRFYKEAIRESQKEYLVKLRNVLSFFIIYANIDQFSVKYPDLATAELADFNFSRCPNYIAPQHRPEIDRWMLTKVERARAAVTTNLENINILGAANALSTLAEDLSNWYVRRNRDRFWQSGLDADKQAAYLTLYESLAKLSLLTAPFTPFFAELVYQRLVRDLFTQAPESVHLCPWLEKAGFEDTEIEKRMDLVRDISSLALSARASAKLKVRQPLAKVIVILTDETMQSAVENLGSIVLDEVNVKELVFAQDASHYVTYNVKPNFEVLGPKLGKAVKSVAKALTLLKQEDIVASVYKQGFVNITVDGQEIQLSREELDIRLEAKEGFVAGVGRAGVVVVDTQVTAELEREGLAREVVNRIASLRKELDLAYDARIKLRIGVSGNVARACIEHLDTISHEVLATDVKVEFADVGNVREYDIAGEKMRISLQTI